MRTILKPGHAQEGEEMIAAATAILYPEETIARDKLAEGGRYQILHWCVMQYGHLRGCRKGLSVQSFCRAMKRTRV